ncbi:MJ1255/VC2487 family glycosyltransferase [Methylomicrobium sp. Wu6]|uniref:MJ1255/VC2487 family glycosyltransferase n=1 Tax=Methylomicrobium sp. Wu6 TaxID=3107928 RepID=UPI002DD6954A|nr:MJ1255/VC2487 family glycosyltransferase [Methylomicrobium sp. Wu6]MEC4749618.1 MJ1255/VC2487 family glycosyltransferase [Methylomicrobium sp. Wu6]
MKIFYGVQGTGNGHITRAREMAKAFAEAGVDVTYLFSGRDAAKYFDMEVFNGYQAMKGLTFHTQNGDVSYLKTALDTRPINFIKEVKVLDFNGYDLVLSDFEPITAWAARLRKKRVLGIGHQYAFNHRIPREGGDFIAESVMKYFAPTRQNIGLHWHHFGQPILPPIIALNEPPEHGVANKIVVYLPFENPSDVVKLLAPFKTFDFFIYTPVAMSSPSEHIRIKPLSRAGFHNDLHDCAGIISNAGFELISEALQLGKKILIKPLHSQLEQISNAAALKQLGYGHIMSELDAKTIAHWLENPRRVRVTYPGVAKILVRWILSGMPPLDDDFIEAIWSHVNVLQLNH